MPIIYNLKSLPVEKQEHYRQLIVSCFQASLLLRKRHFAELLRTPPSRETLSPVRVKLLSEVTKQLRSNLLRFDSNARSLTLSKLLKRFSEESCDTLLLLLKHHDLKVSASEKIASQNAVTFFRGLAGIHELNYLDLRGTGEIVEVLTEMKFLIESLSTLTGSCEVSGIDSLTNGLPAEYFLEGYPQDLLCHDVISARHGERVLMMRTDYCSTALKQPYEQYPDSYCEVQLDKPASIERFLAKVRREAHVA